MPTKDRLTGPLTLATAELEAEILHYEQTSASLDKLPLNSEKTLQRARKVLEECAAHQERLAVLLPAFAQAMQAAQARQQACMNVTAEGTQRIKTRFEERVVLLERIAALGQRAQAINEPVTAILGRDSGQGDPAAEALLRSLDEVGALTEAVIAEADELARAANASEWVDIARDAEALKQQLQTARNKVLVAARNVASRAPS